MGKFIQKIIELRVQKNKILLRKIMPRNNDVKKALRKLASKNRAKISRRFFKRGKGEYGEGDVFIGITVPDTRLVARRFYDLPLIEVQKLLQSAIHEERLCALLMLVEMCQKASIEAREKIYTLYLKNSQYVNNWDLVDLSADKIVGAHLNDKPKNILYRLARSKNVWQRRIAIVATFYFIKNNTFSETLKISKMLLDDPHDLIHKASGWMLREVGKRSLVSEEKFLKKYYTIMPRTMLRYAIERFPERKRKYYLSKTL